MVKYNKTSLIGTWKNFFNNSEEEKCAITKCWLKGKDCKQEYDNDVVQIENEEPWSIFFKSDSSKVIDIEHEFCLGCTNGEQTILSEKSKVIHKTDCRGKL